MLGRVWRGEEPWQRTFGIWGVLVALPINLATTAGTFVLIANDRPLAAFIVGYVLSVPYNMFVLVAVWRAAGRSLRTSRAIALTRLIATVWLGLLSVT